MKAKVYNLEGKVLREENLPAFFDIKIKPVLIQQVVTAQQSNARQILAHAKDRGEVSGGGKKPWRQKGTGRARHGSIRSPLWKGGGATFGPSKERNFSLKINQKAKNQALRMVLADKAARENLILVEELKLAEPKTKKLAAVLKQLPVKDQATLIVLDKKDENIVISARNLPQIMTEAAVSLNVVDLLKYQYLLMPVSAIAAIVKHYSA
ncbi:MAG: 50S ribosomal protein L4 [Candidatus Komeilibacteria bacterium RIFCSPLOWO2_01_FULL_45_10]|uniref:Large ribosomal subunit protein uL4 n=1 Tax=Candidatus Komeilibacteria bacterium RIFCSPLOWO2_01_FULL_45_10 TaxID=1798550 RepID=A0A1G2BLD3_9BACT|nr:MAG: 50S ribosomal protein L4 [Candidatus Komeilibacteria bacterium RIFCSPLOWO2_01_FULL_45_10]